MENSNIFPKRIPKEIEQKINEVYEVIFSSYGEATEETPNKICDEPSLFLGNYVDARDMNILKKHDIKYVLSLMETSRNERYSSDIKWKGIYAIDVDHYNMYQHFEETFQFIEEARNKKST